MKLFRLPEEYIQENMYILKIMKNYILVNGAYGNLTILDFSLRQKDIVPTSISIPNYSYFKCCNKQKIMFYDADDHIILMVSLNDKNELILNTQEIKDVLSPIYYWVNENILVSTYSNDLYAINSWTIRKISEYEVKQTNPLFYNFWKESKKYPIKEDIDACHKTFIYQDEKQNEAVYFDYNTNKKNSIKTPENLEYHDLIYKNGIFAFIAEEAIVLTDGKEECRLLQSPDEFCKRARFIEHDNKLFLIVLLSDMYNLELTKIVKYQVIR